MSHSRARLLLLLPLVASCAGDDPRDSQTTDAPMITSAGLSSSGAALSDGGSAGSDGAASSPGGSTSATTGDVDPSGSSSGAVTPQDAAELVAHTLPSEAPCGAEFDATVTVRNTGAATWTRDALYKLGAVDDEDPLTTEHRAWLPEDVVVAPGESYTFPLSLQAPAEPGSYTTDWQMVHEHVQWFGEIAEATVSVTCEAAEPPPLVLDEVIWLHTDVSDWPVTMTIESVTFEDPFICLNHASQDEGVFVWPEDTLDGDTQVVGNPWVFIYREGSWYGATWEWLRPDQTCKFEYAVAGDHIKQPPFDAQSGWTPSSGETLYFMVSGLARLPGFTNVSERSEPIKVVWP